MLCQGLQLHNVGTETTEMRFGICTFTACIVEQVCCLSLSNFRRPLQANRSNALGTNLCCYCSEEALGGAHDYGLGAKQALNSNTAPISDQNTSDKKDHVSEFSK